MSAPIFTSALAAARSTARATSPGDARLRLIALGGLGCYLALTQVTMGLRAEHVVLATVYITLVAVGGRAFRFLGLFLPCVLTGVTYDFVRVVARLRGEIHVADLYHAELAWFGIDGRVPADWFLDHTYPVLDLVCGVSYVLYLYIPIVLAILLFFRDQRRMFAVGLSFLATNLLGILIYITYPAAPPWYVAEYGLGPANLEVLPNAAGALRFDALLGVDYFRNFYERSANVFGAMPSLHVAYPMSSVLALALGTRSKEGAPKRLAVGVAVFTLVVAFAAVYLQHHYVLDVIAGFACAVAGYAIARPAIDRVFPQAKEPSHG